MTRYASPDHLSRLAYVDENRPGKRKSRFRCQHCSKLIEYGGPIVIETRRSPENWHRGSVGWHRSCWDASSQNVRSAAYAARCRAGEVPQAEQDAVRQAAMEATCR